MKLHFLTSFFLMLFVGSEILCAQQRLPLSVASFGQDPMDMTARSDQYKRLDDNGTLYSIIKVKSSLPNDKLQDYHFNFGYMNSFSELHDDVSELWVYVQKNAKTVTIFREGYTTVNKYDLGLTVGAGLTYNMMLSTTAPTVYTQMVVFSVKPADASAVIMVRSERDGAMEEFFGTTDQTGGVAKSLPFGTYTYKIAAENYYTSEGRFTLDNQSENHIEEVTLRSNFATATFTVDADADIYVDGERRGRRTWTGQLKSGNHRVECRLESHRSTSYNISLEENETRTFQLAAPQPITGTLAVTSTPLGAAITIDGKDYGTAPRNINNLLIGRHSVQLSKDSRHSEPQTAEIFENQTTSLHVDLTKVTTVAAPSTIGENSGEEVAQIKTKKHQWFLHAQAHFSPISIENYGLGVMGGQLGKWGWYGKIFQDLTGPQYLGNIDYDLGFPSIYVGVIKRMYPWLYVHCGGGLATQYVFEDYNYLITDPSLGVEFGFIGKFNHLSLNLGFGVRTMANDGGKFDGSPMAIGEFHFGLGYTF